MKMSLYNSLLTNDAKRLRLEKALEQLIESEIANKNGLEGQAIKTLHFTAKKLIPGILPKEITRQLPTLLRDLEDEYILSKQRGISFSQHIRLEERRQFVVNVIGRAFDQAIARYVVLLPLYQALRSRFEYHIGLAIPNLADLLHNYL